MLCPGMAWQEGECFLFSFLFNTFFLDRRGVGERENAKVPRLVRGINILYLIRSHYKNALR